MFVFKPAYTPIWLGANDLLNEGTWVWQTSATIANFTRFEPGYPNGGTSKNCLIMYQENGSWEDYTCMYTIPFIICEKPTSLTSAPAILQSINYIFMFIIIANIFKFQQFD